MNRKHKLFIFGGGQFNHSVYRRDNSKISLGIW